MNVEVAMSERSARTSIRIYVAQAFLAAKRQTLLHVKIGRLGMIYGVLVILVGLATAFQRFAVDIEAGEILRAQGRLLGPFTDMIVFAALLAGAWVYRRRPDIHKRLIVVATTMLLIAAVARMPFLRGARILSIGEVVPFLLLWLSPIYLAMAHDYYTRRVVHPVYVIGVLVLSLIRMRGPLAEADVWLGFSGWLAKFYM